MTSKLSLLSPLLFSLVLPQAALAAEGWEESPEPAEAQPEAEGTEAEAPEEEASPEVSESTPVEHPTAKPSPPEASPPPPPPQDADAKSENTVVVVNTNPPPKKIRPGKRERFHDGFYLRMSIGGGYLWSEFSPGLLAANDLNGRSGAFDLMLGGTPSDGLVVGAGGWFNGMDHRRAYRKGFEEEEVEGEVPWGSIGVGAIGPFLDYYPRPRGGFHVGGMVGFAGISVDGPGMTSDAVRDSAGGALGAWIGFDGWVGKQWSLGGQVRYLGVVSENEIEDWQGRADTLTLSFTAVFH